MSEKKPAASAKPATTKADAGDKVSAALSSHGKRIGDLEDRLAKVEAALRSAINVSID